jgi:VCBS repeat-containing protein
MAGAMTGEDKEENEELEGVQTPKENGTGEYMIHAQGSYKFVQDNLKEVEQTVTTFMAESLSLSL